MNEIDEKTILNEAPDFDNQLKILEEEHKSEVKKRKWFILIGAMSVMIVLIFIVSYSTLYTYRPYGPGNIKPEEDVNIDGGEDGPDINITENNKNKDDKKGDSEHGSSSEDYIPRYNVDYYNNRKVTFNVDLYGDRSDIFNKINQMDSSNSYCVLNCDPNKDGWPDYNIDFNGDGKPEVNIVVDPKDDLTCKLNCDLNLDTIPDTNVDINNDGIADINITDGKSDVPKYNIDYMNNRIPTFNIKDGDNVINPVNPVKDGQICDSNCDIDGDGWPDYNIKLTENDNKINELIDSTDSYIDYSRSRTIDWKCVYGASYSACTKGKTTKNTYINIDVNGDGIADINISSDNGRTLDNEINKPGRLNGKKVILNYDADNDGFPDFNIDVNNDGIPDLNIKDNKENKCIKNCDSNMDGVPDYLIDVDGTNRNNISVFRLNLDIDYDTVYDVNIDTNNDLYPDINIDLDGDKIPELNIDYDHDGIADLNIDSDHDGKPDINIDVYHDGLCNFNCDVNGELINVVDKGKTCTRNCDTNNDGLPDKYVDINNDNVCDFNCDSNHNDVDNNYYDDKTYDQEHSTISITNINDEAMYVVNPLDIKSSGVEPGWEHNYIITISNNSNFARKYKIKWDNVSNDFTEENNLYYYITRNGTNYLADLRNPYQNVDLTSEVIVRAKTSIKYVARFNFKETGKDQSIDSGKSFYGKLKVDIVK